MDNRLPLKWQITILYALVSQVLCFSFSIVQQRECRGCVTNLDKVEIEVLKCSGGNTIPLARIASTTFTTSSTRSTMAELDRYEREHFDLVHFESHSADMTTDSTRQ